MSCHSLLSSVVSDEKSAVIWTDAPLQVMCHFSPVIFRIFWFLFLVFRNIVMMCLGMHFFVLSYLGFFSASYNCRFMSFAKLGKFQPLLLQILFEPHLLPLLRLQWYTRWIFCPCAWGSIHFFFQFLFFLLCMLGKFYFLFSGSLILSSVVLLRKVFKKLWLPVDLDPVSWSQVTGGSSPPPLSLKCGFYFLFCSQRLLQGYTLR